MVAPVGGHQGPALRYGRGVLLRWQGGRAAIVVTVAAGVLIVLDTTDAGLRRWWLAHALTTDMVSCARSTTGPAPSRPRRRSW
jgi:hypothetical protein